MAVPTITDGKPHRKQLHESVVCWANMELDLVRNACCFPVRLPCTQRGDTFSSSVLSVHCPMPDCLASELALPTLHALMGVATAGFAMGQGAQYTCTIGRSSNIRSSMSFRRLGKGVHTVGAPTAGYCGEMSQAWTTPLSGSARAMPSAV